MLTDFTSKNIKIFFCENCDFKCCKKGDYNRHLSTAKHQNLTNFNKKHQKTSNHICDNCNKTYKSRVGLWYHEKKCDNKDKNKTFINVQEITPSMILSVIQQNQELQKQVLEISKNSNNTTNITSNSHNKTFNLQVFLNETCKDAMNIMDFVDSIKLQLSDLESVGELGYINGLSKIIIKNLKALDENMRPVHCSDLKRERIYVKDAGKWEKECADNKILKNAIKYIAHKNVKMIPAFREKYPDCIYSDSRKSDQYNRLIIEAMGGDGNDENEKSNKIIKKIAKEILIDK
jgi:hypothetical protein